MQIYLKLSVMHQFTQAQDSPVPLTQDGTVIDHGQIMAPPTPNIPLITATSMIVEMNEVKNGAFTPSLSLQKEDNERR